jgi:hypothetical protein
MRAYEVYEDTQESKALDAYLERVGKQTEGGGVRLG